MNRPTRIPPRSPQGPHPSTPGVSATSPDPPQAAVGPRSPHDTVEDQLAALEAQLARLRRQTQQSQRLVSLGVAAATMAHEYNNLMTPVVSYARYALEHEDTEVMKKALRTTLRQSEILSAMSNRILGLARHEAPSYRAVSIAEVVTNARECLCRDLSKDGIVLHVDIDEGLRVWADDKQLQQVLFNLLLNARQAMRKTSGRLTISAAPADAERIAIRVQDTGRGIAPERLATVFQPFVTDDRGPDSGTGLGLSICRDIVEEHRGSIEVESIPQQGTTFTILLPSAR